MDFEWPSDLGPKSRDSSHGFKIRVTPPFDSSVLGNSDSLPILGVREHTVGTRSFLIRGRRT